MALYVEVMCDVRTMGRDPDDILRLLCWSDMNENPDGSRVGQARKAARKQGWKLSGRYGAICPGCQRAALNPSPERRET